MIPTTKGGEKTTNESTEEEALDTTGFVSDLVSHLFDRDARWKEIPLEHSSGLYKVVSTFAPEKLNIKTLIDIFKVFNETCDWSEGCKAFFEYDDRMWKGTSKRFLADYKDNYESRKVEFINVKLPNDGFFYTSKYNGKKISKTPFLMTELKITDETVPLLNELTVLIGKKKLFGIGKILIKYSVEVQRLDMYYWSNDNPPTKCITIKFENYQHESAHYQEESTWSATLQDTLKKINTGEI